jgi:hypothetical protein
MATRCRIRHRHKTHARCWFCFGTLHVCAVELQSAAKADEHIGGHRRKAVRVVLMATPTLLPLQP